jgi:putative tryptophan/tyrosine transport system substrate-binding protein
MGSFRLLTLVALLGLLSPSAAAAQPNVVALLSSRLGPYSEALEGFRETIGVPFTVSDLSEGAARVGARTRVVVAFGGKAALSTFPRGAALVYCMAPGTQVPENSNEGPRIRIHMVPPPAALLDRLKTIQPGVKRIAVIWSSDAMDSYIKTMRDDAERIGIELLVERVEGGRDLPSSLRDLIKKRPDALWLPADPLLVNPESFSILKGFTWSNEIPFYAPTDGLVERGAAAAVSSDFREIGRTAGRAARLVLTGKEIPPDFFPERILMSFNLSAAASCGLRIPADVLKRADRVYP